MNDEFCFWHVDKHRSLLQVDTIILVVYNKACPKHPQYKPPPFCWWRGGGGGKNFHSHILKRRDQKKYKCLGGFINLLPQIFAWERWGEAYYISCQRKTLWNKISRWGLRFKCWPILTKQPINVVLVILKSLQ